MLSQITRKEIVLYLRESRFAWMAGLFCGLVILSALLMAGIPSLG